MADDNRLRSFRTNDPYRPDAEPARSRAPAGASDPLAELARLIGQSDPFAEFGRSNSRQAASARQPLAAPQPTPRPAAPIPQAYRSPDERGDYGLSDDYSRNDYSERDLSPRDYSERDLSPRDYSERQLSPRDQGERDYGQRDYAPNDYSQHDDLTQHDNYAQHADYARQVRDQERYAEPAPPPRDNWRRSTSSRQGQGYARQEPDLGWDQDSNHDPRSALLRGHYEESRLAPPEPEYAEEVYPDQRSAHLADVQEAEGHEGEHHSDQPIAADQQADPYYEHAALEPQEDESYDDAPRARHRGGLATALALIGCAMLGTAGAYAYRSYVSNPSSSQPPPVITADNSTPTKIVPASQGDSGKAIQDRMANAGKEQVVSNQEEPVALKELGTQTAPRVVLPAPVTPAPGGTPATTQSVSPPTANPTGSEPKKVRTVVIRSDGSDASGRPVGGLPPSSQPLTTASTRASTTPPAPRANGGSAPLALNASEQPAPTPPAPRTRTASATTGYVVQLSSQKTEAEAQASFRALQAKFPNALGGRDPIVRRVDLGSKGIYYRTMVGPFASSHEAGQFCASYKAAGGQCVVPTVN